ncbi:hypothetical protein ACMA5I_06540 [Paracoccaceae bacterium GXU_MW_L88]
MNLRSRIEEELGSRLMEFLPEAMETVWDHKAVIVANEVLKFGPDGGHFNDTNFEIKAAFEGVLYAELRGDDVDQLATAPLIADLVANPIHLLPVADGPGTMTEQARATLIEIRDKITDQQVVTAMRLSVEGFLLREDAPRQRPNLMIGQAPDIGFGHEDDYEPIGAWGG